MVIDNNITEEKKGKKAAKQIIKYRFRKRECSFFFYFFRCAVGTGFVM